MARRSRQPLALSPRLRCHRLSRKSRNPYPWARQPTSASKRTRPSLTHHRPSPTHPPPMRLRRRPSWQRQLRHPVRSQPPRRRAPCLPTLPICGPPSQQRPRQQQRRAHHCRRRRARRRFIRLRGKATQPSQPSCVKAPDRRNPQARRAWERKPSLPRPPGQLPGRHRLTPRRERACSDWWALLPASSPGWPGQSETAQTTPPCLQPIWPAAGSRRA